MVAKNPLPDGGRAFEIARARYESDPTNDNLRAIAVESAPWNFIGPGIAMGARSYWHARATTRKPCGGRRRISIETTN
jgi:hypothetical protein